MTHVKTSDPSIKLGPAKAFAGGAVTTVVAFLTAFITANADQAVTGNEWAGIALATVLGAAAGFGITYVTPTTVTLK